MAAACVSDRGEASLHPRRAAGSSVRSAQDEGVSPSKSCEEYEGVVLVFVDSRDAESRRRRVPVIAPVIEETTALPREPVVSGGIDDGRGEGNIPSLKLLSTRRPARRGEIASERIGRAWRPPLSPTPVSSSTSAPAQFERPSVMSCVFLPGNKRCSEPARAVGVGNDPAKASRRGNTALGRMSAAARARCAHEPVAARPLPLCPRWLLPGVHEHSVSGPDDSRHRVCDVSAISR